MFSRWYGKLTCLDEVNRDLMNQIQLNQLMQLN